MAASVVLFPAKSEHTEIDRLIRRYLGELSADTELRDSVAARMKIYIDRFANKTFEPIFDLAVPANMSHQETQALLRSIERGVDAAGEQYEKMICEIIIERLFFEVEMFEYRKKKRASISDESPSLALVYSTTPRALF